MAGGIFISYRRQDTAHAAGRLYDHLKMAFPQRRLFMDVDKIRPGQDFVQVLDESLASCEIMLVIIGGSWVTPRLHEPDDFVRREMETALRRRIAIYPILVDGARMPLSGEIPDSLQLLLRQQSISIRHDEFGQGASRVVEALSGQASPKGENGEPLIEEIPQAQLEKLLAEYERIAKEKGDVGLYEVLDRDKGAADIIARAQRNGEASRALAKWAWERIRILDNKAAKARALRLAINRKYLGVGRQEQYTAKEELFSLTYRFPRWFYRKNAGFSLASIAIVCVLWINLLARFAFSSI